MIGKSPSRSNSSSSTRALGVEADALPGGRKQEEEEESARRAKAMRRSEEAAFHGAQRPGEDLRGITGK